SKARLEQTRQDLMTQGVRAYLSVIRGREMVKYATRSEENIKRLSGMQEALVERGAGLSYEELQVKAQLAGAQATLVNTERSLDAALNNFRAVFGLTLASDQVDKLVMPKMPLELIPGTLDECIAVSTAENPYLAELMHNVERNSGQVEAIDANFYPAIDLVGEYYRKEQDQGAQGVRYETKGSLQVSYNIFNGWADTDASKSARADLTSARKSVLDRQRTVEENVRNSWLDLTTLKKNMELYENQANITWEFLALVKKKKAMGAEVGLLDILVGERDYISAISAKVGAEIDYNIAAYTLLFQMGRMNSAAVGGV
ncbi:MAG: TolC family protein, partial [Proteobacteria bacterium]|nr:TolC family protein [Pseudomonadota bacterium]